MLHLYYVHDPMCSWCYAFKPVLKQLQQQLPEGVGFSRLSGGLAADSDEPMPAAMRRLLRSTWERIEQKVPGIEFNYVFWDNWQETQPRRSTYPACRAVIAAHHFDQDGSDKYETLMIEAIQQAYYQQALNPSDTDVLLKLAVQAGLDEMQFSKQLQAEQTQTELARQIAQCRQMNARSFPSLVLQIEQSFWPVSIDYLSVAPILESINMLLDFEAL